MVIAGVVVAAAAVGGIWYLATMSGRTPENTSKEQGASGSEKGGAPAGVAKTNDRKPETPAPVRLTMGSENPEPAPGSGVKPAPGVGPGKGPGVTPSEGTPAGRPPVPSNSGSTTPPSTTPGTEMGKPGSVDVTGGGGTPPTGTPGTDAGAGGSPASPLPPTGSTSDMLALIAEGNRKMSSNDLLGARAAFSKALINPKTVREDQEALRSKLTTINQDLVFSSKVYAGDPMVEEYVVESGDGLQRIARKRALVTDWRLIERVNKVDSTKLRVGQKLKLVRGPFHAVVSKSDYRLDIFWGPPGNREEWIYIRSFRVGLGPNTPEGDFVLKLGSKQINPPWTNPHTREKFEADDPKNPIGEHWIGIEGVGEAAKFKGFGIHGTVEPDSIGQSKSMGCVRMLDADVALVYELLVDPVSVVRLVP
jgi:LysM repeat protein